MGTVSTIDGRRRMDELAREIAAITRELAETCLTAELAAERGDLDVLSESTERASDLEARWRLAFRALLAKRTGPLREYSSL